MPAKTREEEIALGIIPPPPGQDEVDPNPRLRKIPRRARYLYRQPLTLTDKQLELVKKTLKNCWAEWDQNTNLLKSKLRRYNDLMEGIKEPKTFPWINSSNLHMPLIEIHITIMHSLVSQTMLENDPIFYVKVLQDDLGDSVDTDIESYLHSICKTKLHIDNDLSDIYWNTFRDGTGIGNLDWVEEFDRVYDVRVYNSVEEFVADFPTPESAGVAKKEYEGFVQELIDEGSTSIKIEETVVKYRGPRLRVIELKDFVVVPTTSPSLDYALFVGDVFRQRADYFRRKALDGWFDKDETSKMLKKPGAVGAPDSISQAQDTIEGIARGRVTTPDEYDCLQGILRINLSDDEFSPEKKYLVTYNRETDTLLRIEDFPYFHNRCNYIVWRFKKRSGRLLGQSIPDQLVDINEEIDTQHNQRVDSRTITTVPSFIRLETADFDPTRSDQRFYPGVTFKTSAFNSFKQFDIKQTDLGESLSEEQNLMAIADLRTGAFQQARGGQQKDSRAPAKKMMLQLQQSAIRADDPMRELRVSTAEVGSQILELSYQFSPEIIFFNKKDPGTEKFVRTEIERQKLRTSGLVIDVARTSVMDNPSAVLQRELTIYEMMLRNPVVASNLARVSEVSRRLLKAMRERNIDKIIPTQEQLIQELQAQEKLNNPGAGPNANALGERLRNGGGNSPAPNHGRRNGQTPARPEEPMPPL